MGTGAPGGQQGGCAASAGERNPRVGQRLLEGYCWSFTSYSGAGNRRVGGRCPGVMHGRTSQPKHTQKETFWRRCGKASIPEHVTRARRATEGARGRCLAHATPRG